MTPTVEHLLESFEQLTESEKQDLAIEVVRRTDIFGSPDLSDDELALAAEDLFLTLDREEAEAEKAESK
jgi:hypothetical protein